MKVHSQGQNHGQRQCPTGAPTRHIQGMAEKIYWELSKTEHPLKLSHCCFFFFSPLPSFSIIVKYMCCCLVAKHV